VRALLLACSLVVAAAAPLRAQAQDDEPPAGGQGQGTESGQSPENIEAAREAREHFETGLGHFEEHRYREAIRQFELAGQLVPSADLWFNIARAHEELSEHERAAEYYRRYLRDRVDPPDRDEVEQHIARLEERAEEARLAQQERPTTGTLRVRSNVEGAAVFVDDRQVGQAPIRMPLSLQPGRHRVTVRSEGYVPFESEVRVDAGVTSAAYADLEPATRYESIQGSRVFTWIVGGLSVVALGTSLYFGARASAEQSDGNLVEAEEIARNSDYALGGAIGLGVGAIVLYFLEGRAVGTRRSTGPPGSEAGSGGD